MVDGGDNCDKQIDLILVKYITSSSSSSFLFFILKVAHWLMMLYVYICATFEKRIRRSPQFVTFIAERAVPIE